MKHAKQGPWYVGERSEALARLFILELEPDYVGAPATHPAPYDYIATFSRDDASTVTILVEVKGTEQPLPATHWISMTPAQVHAAQRSNTPFLFIVVDVKRNEIGFNWASALKGCDAVADQTRHRRYQLPLRRATPEEVSALRSEILRS